MVVLASDVNGSWMLLRRGVLGVSYWRLDPGCDGEIMALG